MSPWEASSLSLLRCHFLTFSLPHILSLYSICPHHSPYHSCLRFSSPEIENGLCWRPRFGRSGPFSSHALSRAVTIAAWFPCPSHWISWFVSRDSDARCHVVESNLPDVLQDHPRLSVYSLPRGPARPKSRVLYMLSLPWKMLVSLLGLVYYLLFVVPVMDFLVVQVGLLCVRPGGVNYD